MKRMNAVLVLLATGLACAGGAPALDADEIANLVRSGVQDSVIINMVQGQKLDRPLTTGEVMSLNANGASAQLLEFLTRPDAVNSAYVAPPPAAAIVGESVYPSVVSAPTVVSSPQVVVTTPPTVYYEYDYYDPGYVYPYYGSSWPGYYGGFWWGGGGYRYRDHRYRDYRHGPPRYGHGGRGPSRPSPGFRPGGGGPRPGGGRPRPPGGRPGRGGRR